MKRLVVLSGAGMSAESGIKTFRDSDGLLYNYIILYVCTNESFARFPELLYHLYNDRRIHLYQFIAI